MPWRVQFSTRTWEMQPLQDWLFVIRGREIAARVDVDESGAGFLRGYSVTSGPSQVGIEISVLSKAEAASKIEELLTLLLGPSW